MRRLVWLEALDWGTDWAFLCGMRLSCGLLSQARRSPVPVSLDDRIAPSRVFLQGYHHHANKTADVDFMTFSYGFRPLLLAHSCKILSRLHWKSTGIEFSQVLSRDSSVIFDILGHSRVSRRPKQTRRSSKYYCYQAQSSRRRALR